MRAAPKLRGAGRSHPMNKTTVAATSRTNTIGGFEGRRGTMATISHAIPDVMNQKNIGSVIGMLQTAQGLLD